MSETATATAAWRRILDGYRKRREYFGAIGLVTLWGAFLRVAYFLSTRVDHRSYDLNEHVNYIVYVVRTFQLPPPHLGWEFHQPPLYYFAVAVWVKIGMLFGRPTEMLSVDVRFFSLFLSLASLGLCAWIAVGLFPRERWKACLFLLVPAALPGIVFMASRVTNDALAFPLSLLWFGLFLRWWSRGKETTWIAASVALGLALLTKFSAAPFVPAMFLCLAARRGLSRATKLRLGLIAAIAIALIAGWQIVLRPVAEYADVVVGSGAGELNPQLYVEATLKTFLTFNPALIVWIPFANPWLPGPTRDGFWEFLVRSAFFGEWEFKPLLALGRNIMLVAMILLPAAALGAWRSVRARWEYWLPFVATAGSLLLFLVAYRSLHACACNQDFRFVPLMGLVGAGWLTLGSAALPRPYRIAAAALAFLLAVMTSAFLLSLGFIPWP